MRNGTHSATLRTQLINFANSIPALGETNGRRTVDVGGISHVGADAVAIRAANGGDMPIIRMFEQNEGSVITGGSSQTLDQAADNFTMQQWMLMYITFPVNGHPIFTFMMTNSYRLQRFNHDPAPRPIPGRNIYSQQGDMLGDPSTFNGTDGSEVRNRINYDFEHVLSQFSSIDSNVFVTPGELPGTWQSREPDVTSPNREFHSLCGARLDDRIWLPSSFELGDGNTGNLWGATRNETGSLGGTINFLDKNGFDMWSWMRSRETGHVSNIRMFSGRDYSSHFSSRTPGNPVSIRPAIHLDLTLLIPALDEPDVSVTRTKSDELTVSWDTVPSATSYRVKVGSDEWETIAVPTTEFRHPISTTGTFNFQVYAVGDGLNFVNSIIVSEAFTVNQEQLAAPSNLQISGGQLSWNSTGSLGTYVVYLNNVAHSSQLTETSWEIPTTLGPGTWTLQVKATAPSSTWFMDSELSTVRNHTIAPTVTGITITANTTKENWYQSETFVATGIVLTVAYSDASSRTQNNMNLMTITAGTWVEGPVVITVTYAGATATFNVLVSIPTNNEDTVTVNGDELVIVPGSFFLVEHLTIPEVKYGYEFVGWSADGGLTILADADQLEPGMVITSITREIPNGGTDTFPWRIIIGAVAGVLLIAGVSAFVVLRRKGRSVKNDQH